MLFDDQTGRPVATARARPGPTWIRLATDIPTSQLATLPWQLNPWEFVKSMATFDAEPVFSLTDPVSGLAEMALIPYLFYKRGF